MINFVQVMETIRRGFILIFTATYFLLSVGLGITVHYCHGDLSSVSYITSSPECECENGSMDMACCSTIQQYYQLDEEGLTTTADISLSIPIISEDFRNEFVPYAEERTRIILDQVMVESPPKYILFSKLVLYA